MRIEFKPNITDKQKMLLNAGKITGVIISVLGIAITILSVINQIDVIFGVAILIVGLLTFIFTYFYSKRASAGELWIEGGILYMKGGGLPPAYFRCVPLNTITAIDYKEKTKEFTLTCQNNLTMYNEQTNKLKVISTSSTFQGYDIYTPSLIDYFIENFQI